MKKLLIFFFISYNTFGQIKILSLENGSITISPKGILGKTNQDTSLGSIALGTNALASNPTGYFNTAIGDSSLRLNTSGRLNSAFGSKSLQANYSGALNTALGAYSMHENLTGETNTAVGMNSLRENRNGDANTAIGTSAMFNNWSGKYNIAIGNSTMFNNYNGFGNIGIGVTALGNSYEAWENTVVGNESGLNINNGKYNTLIGAMTNTLADFSNATAIGAYTIVDASNKVRIGNSAVTVIEGQVPWSNPSDRRLKENITYTNRLGLDFITRLQTVSYNYMADGNKTRYDGFIAQDIEKVMKDIGIPFSGLKKSDNGMYSLAYSDFVMPLVNAVKEQQVQIDVLKKQNQTLSARLSEIDEIKAELMKLKSSVNTKPESK